MFNKLVTILLLSFFCSITYSQEVKYTYDKADRLVLVVYPNQMAINYYYDADGNRIRKVTTNVSNIVDPNNPSSSSNDEVFLYPNPTKGDFKKSVLRRIF